jgi:hypothetical protein
VSATPEQPADLTPTSAAPEPAAPPPFTPAPPIETPAAASAPAPDGSGLAEQHPEALVGGAFLGGAVLALVLKRLGRR